MSAELLRRAAEVVRRQPVLGTREVSLAIADVLDHAADNFYTYFNPHLDALARLIVGEES